jgi:DNA polymerase-1
VWKELVGPAAAAVVDVEHWGVPADKEAVRGFALYLDGQQRPLHGQFKAIGVNPDSQPQVAKHLYQTLGLPKQHLTDKGAPAADEEALRALAGQHAFVDLMLAWRTLAKLRGTYADGGKVGAPGIANAGMMAHIRADSRIHGSIKIAGTETGRASMEDPNLQQIPRPETPTGRMARAVLCAPDNRVLVEADYSQQELRVACMLSGDAAMADIFRAGVDYHRRTAELIARAAWNLDASQLTEAHRSLAKIVNFSLVYGKSDEGLAQELGVSVRQAAQIRRAVLGTFPALARWLQDQERLARDTGYVWTVWKGRRARRRALYDIVGDDGYKAGNARRAAGNTPIQGLASDFCLSSLARLVQWIRAERHPAKLVMTVHDALVLETPEHLVPEVVAKVRETMLDYDTGGGPPSAACRCPCPERPHPGSPLHLIIPGLVAPHRG